MTGVTAVFARRANQIAFPGLAVSSPSAKNIPLNTSGKSVALTRAVSCHRGALRNVINAAGDAVDANARFDEQR
jgi:hypothetical protein